MRIGQCLGVVVAIIFVATGHVDGQACDGKRHVLNYGGTSQNAFLMDDGSLATRARVAVNADGMKRAYHRDDIAGGGLISLCNAGTPHPAGRPSYNASADNSACRRFSEDYRAIRQAGWKDPTVGVIHWFGVLGRDSARIGSKTISEIVPVEQADGSGFFVSPTALEDPVGFPDPADQRRYIDAETIPAAVIRNSPAMTKLGITKGTLGVAIHADHRTSVPFVVGDYGPRIGEGTFALGRLLKRLPLVTATRQNIFSADISEEMVLWTFFGGRVMKPPYTQTTVSAKARQAFDSWGGESRLSACLANANIPVAQ